MRDKKVIKARGRGRGTSQTYMLRLFQPDIIQCGVRILHQRALFNNCRLTKETNKKEKRQY